MPRCFVKRAVPHWHRTYLYLLWQIWSWTCLGWLVASKWVEIKVTKKKPKQTRGFYHANPALIVWLIVTVMFFTPFTGLTSSKLEWWLDFMCWQPLHVFKWEKRQWQKKKCLCAFWLEHHDYIQQNCKLLLLMLHKALSVIPIMVFSIIGFSCVVWEYLIYLNAIQK